MFTKNLNWTSQSPPVICILIATYQLCLFPSFQNQYPIIFRVSPLFKTSLFFLVSLPNSLFPWWSSKSSWSTGHSQRSCQILSGPQSSVKNFFFSFLRSRELSLLYCQGSRTGPGGQEPKGMPWNFPFRNALLASSSPKCVLLLVCFQGQQKYIKMFNFSSKHLP